MEKEYFLNLVKKHLSGKSTTEEEKQLLNYYNSFQKNDFEEDYSEVSSKIKENIFKNVHKEIGREHIKFLRKKTILKYAAIAILFLGLGYIYKNKIENIQRNHSFIQQKNAITLEMENGKTKIISEDETSEIKDIEGKVIASQNGNLLVYTNETDTEELVYNTLTVPYGKKFELQLSDGTTAFLNSGSSLKYPIKFLKGMDRQVFLTGEVFLDVRKDSVHPFILNADNLSVQVLGTKFNVSAYPEDETSDVVLVEGSVKLYGDKEGMEPVFLKPGFKGSYYKKNNHIDTQEVITGIYTSWMNGGLVFRNMSFQNILKKIERHYNVTIINKNQRLSYEKFNANFGVEPLKKVLENLKTTYGIDYMIDKDKITIY